MSTSTQQDTAFRGSQAGGTAIDREATGRGRQRGSRSPERIAKGLGWFSIGLGLAQITTPRGVARLIGINNGARTRDTMFAVGLRELASGIGILTRPQASGWVWSRVGGDVMDLAALGSALNSPRNNRNRVAAATAAVAGVTLLDFFTGQQLRRTSRATGRRGRGIHVAESITIARSPEELYRFWRNFENLPRFMEHLEAVQTLDDHRSHWRVRAPAGTEVEWDAELIDDQPHRLIAWRSLDGADIPNAGVVRFVPAPGNQGTEVHVELSYDPPGGRVAALFAKLFGEEPQQQVASDLRRLKQVLEAGEIIKSDSSIYRRPHPAQPPAQPVSTPPSVTGGV
ncbi:MAG TPA: SRPBCC family protein [Gemmatimonadales bacterium]|nr:SRPBCC family protein [Gemmatimonadales bacterium]